MAHKFDPKNKAKLKSDKRRANLPPEKVLNHWGLQPKERLIDVGCGIGFFTIPASEMVTEQGRIYALDTVEEMTEYLRDELKALNRENVTVVQSAEYGFPLPEATGDRLLMSMVLHEVADKVRFLRESRRVLKPEGKILIVEWQKIETEEGPPLKHRLAPEETRDYLLRAGFKNPAVLAAEYVSTNFYLYTAEA